MYQFSRAIYRDLAPYIVDGEVPACGHEVNPHQEVLHACEAVLERLASDRHYFKRPARTLFNDIRVFFPMSVQHRVYRVVATYLDLCSEWLVSQPVTGFDLMGNKLECRATTRKGRPCQRVPLPHNGYCPSHQHLAATEESEPLIAA